MLIWGSESPVEATDSGKLAQWGGEIIDLGCGVRRRMWQYT
ncbi:hypothetical protein OJE16_20575 [Pantoea tagorei]|nr:MULTISPECIES: hypothetical protein [Pantoea]